MAVAELIVKFQEKDFSALDGIRGDKKFSSLSSFTASKESLQWVREYLSETLFYSRKCAKEQEKSGVLWGGWFQERDVYKRQDTGRGITAVFEKDRSLYHR